MYDELSFMYFAQLVHMSVGSAIFRSIVVFCLASLISTLLDLLVCLVRHVLRLLHKATLMLRAALLGAEEESAPAPRRRRHRQAGED